MVERKSRSKTMQSSGKNRLGESEEKASIRIEKDDSKTISAPDHIYDKSRKGWYESFGASMVEKNRYFMLLLISLLAIVALAISFSFLMPMKTVVPYAIRVHDDGTVDAQIMTQANYVPGEPEKRYFIGQWVEGILTIDPTLSEIYLPASYRMTMGRATEELRKMIETQKPIERAKIDGIKRKAEVTNISFITPEVAMVVVDTVTSRKGYTGEIREKYRVSVKFSIIQPKTEEEIMNNPIGLYVSDYTINKDINQ